MPKFQPRIVPKNIQLHDTNKKQHITFDNDNNDNEKPVLLDQEKKQNPIPQNKKNNKRSLLDSDQKQAKKPRQENNNNNNNKNTTTKNKNTNNNKAKKGKAIGLPYLKEVKQSFKTSKPKLDHLTKEQREALEEQRGLAKREANRRKKKEKKKAKQLAQVVNGTVIKRSILHLTPTKLNEKKQHPSVTEIRQFALYCLMDDNPPSFCHITNRDAVEHVVIIYASGLDIAYFGAPSNRENVPFSIDLSKLTSADAIGKGNMPFLTSSVFGHMFITKISGTKGFHLNPTSQLLQSQVTNTRKRQLYLERKQMLEKENVDKNKLFILELEELKAYGYPIPSFLDESSTLPEGWKETRPALEPTDKKKLVALDCEMVLTKTGRALARVSLVDEDGNILLDEYVKPDEPIVDHLTEYSGITPELMKEATCSLRRAQKHIRKIVDHNVILIGHSLDSDLNALQIAHPYCADTSLLYDSHRGPPYKPSLKQLATIYLKRMIQATNKETKGHNSAEDALATMDLFKLKVKNGFMFGRKKNDMEMIFDRLQRHQVPKKGMILESNNGIQTFQSGMGVHYENVATDEKLTQELIQHLSLKDQNFILAKYDNLKFRDLEDDDVPPVVISSVTVDKVRAKKLSMFDQSIKQIYDEAPKNTAIVVMGGLGYVPNYTRLLKKYNKYKEFMQLRKTGEEDIEEKTWTKEDQAELEMESKKAKLSCTFVTIK